MARSRSGHGSGAPTRVDAIMVDVMHRLGIERDLDDYRIWQAWDEVVGAQVARNAQPQRLDTHRLVVVVKSAAWMQELSLLRKDICRRLNEWMGREVVSEIFLVVGKVEAVACHGGSAAGVTARDATGSAAAAAAPQPEDLETALDRLWRTARERRRD